MNLNYMVSDAAISWAKRNDKMGELKKCPFCHSEVLLYEKVLSNKELGLRDVLYYIQCLSCKIKTAEHGCDRHVEELWNKRWGEDLSIPEAIRAGMQEMKTLYKSGLVAPDSDLEDVVKNILNIRAAYE